MPTTEDKRLWTYQALISECKDRWATCAEIWQHVPEEKKMPAVLDGLVALRELEAKKEDGATFYRLTDWGERFAQMMVVSAPKREKKEEPEEQEEEDEDAEYSF
jgi:hypothetical protein